MSRPKVLSLHGFTANSQIHAYQMRPLTQALPEYEFIFPNSPHLLPDLDDQPVDRTTERMKFWEKIVKDKSTLGHRAWFFTQNGKWMNDETGNLHGLLESIKLIGRILEEHGPIHAIVFMGMSQGGTFSVFLSALFQPKHANHPLRKYLPKNLPRAAAISIGGTRVEFAPYRSLYEEGVDVPTLHVLGDNDAVVDIPRQERLVTACRDPVVLHFRGGHEVPHDGPDRERIVNFIKANVEV